MRKLQKRSKRLVKLLLVISVAALSACSTLPPAPEGELGVHDQAAALVRLSDISTGDARDPVAISMTDNWVMFSPDTWESVSNYIDELIRRLEARSLAGTKEPVYIVKLEHLYALKRKLHELKH